MKKTIIILVFASFLILVFYKIYLLDQNLCGFLVGSGNHVIKCECLGFVIEKPDTKGTIGLESTLEYCLGFPRTNVCFDESGARQVMEPYLCSDYPYQVSLTKNVSQHPLYFSPESKFSYDALNEKGLSVVLETKKEVKCAETEVKVMGYYKQVTLGDGSGKTKQDYKGYHLFAVDFKCQ